MISEFSARPRVFHSSLYCQTPMISDLIIPRCLWWGSNSHPQDLNADALPLSHNYFLNECIQFVNIIYPSKMGRRHINVQLTDILNKWIKCNTERWESHWYETGGLFNFKFYLDLLCIFALISLCKLLYIFVEKPAELRPYVAIW